MIPWNNIDGLGAATPTVVPIGTVSAVGPSYSLPAGSVWVNQAGDQYLSASDAAKIGSLCFDPFPGRYVVSGNGVYSALQCQQKDLISSSPALSMAAGPLALAAIAYFLLPPNMRLFVALPLAAWGVFGAMTANVVL
jgi:hypothetical protein